MSDKSSDYPVGYSERIIKLFSQRNIQTNAQFLLPYLKSGLSLLDCGCGPGSITVDFANKLFPGRVVGVDVSEEQINFAKQIASENHITNIEFHQASATELPFEDDTFDIAFTNSLLCHVKDPMVVIKELKRVVKPGGIVASREMDWGGQIIYPENPLLLEALELREKALRHLDCDYRVGRKLVDLYSKAGFQKTIPSAACVVIPNEGALNDIPEIMAQQWEDAPFAKVILEKGWATKKQIEEYQEALRNFSKTPGAFRCWTWCQIVASYQ